LGRFGVERDLAVASALLASLFVSPAGAQPSPPTGLYVRADVGAAFEQNVTFKDTNPSAANCDLCGDMFPSSTGRSVFLGGGAGYWLGRMFRADLTLDYLTLVKISGMTTAAAPSTASADFDSLIGLANGYFEFAGAFPDDFGQLQPFLSVGIGIARDHLDTTRGVSPLIGPFTIESHSRMNVAWALGAGAGFVLSPETTIELEYRYLNTGGLRTGATLTAGGTPFQLTPLKSGDLSVHAVMLGVRYRL